MSKLNRSVRRFGVATAFVALAAFGMMPAASAADEASGPAVIRRLSPEQYKQIIADIFGEDIKIGGRFEPDIRENGLLAVGSSRVSVTTSGLEQYDGMARTIAAQVVDEKVRDSLIPCKPASATEPDDACAKQFLSRVGRLLYRRPLTEPELQGQVASANNATKTMKNFYTGLGMSLAGMLESPKFLFRKQVVEADPDNAGKYRLNNYSKASQLSFFLWNAEPDEILLAAAEKGELNTEKGLAKQVDRMVASPRVAGGVRAFFIDMLAFDQFETLAKDVAIYPKFTPRVNAEAQEQTLRTLTDLLVTHRGDYRDIFTTRRTFLTPPLGIIYGVPVRRDVPNGADDGWQVFEYPENDPRAGVLAQISFVALHSHPGRSSPTIRGKALREVVLCQKVPDPPGNVDFTLVQDTNGQYKTARDRVTAHRSNAVCAGCHKIMDPMGLAMENFDGSGGFRMAENGVAIDSSGELDGVAFKDMMGLAKAIHDSPAATSCVVSRVSSYALGRVAAKGETEWVKTLQKDFATSGYKVTELFKRIAMSPEYYRVAAPQTGALEMPASRLASQTNQKGVEQ